MKIHIDRLRVHAHHGVLPQERTVGADFLLTLTAEVEVGESALQHDDLEGTVNYASLVEVMRREMSVPSALLEHVCHRTAKALLREFPRLREVTLRIDKVAPPIDGLLCDALGVEVTYSSSMGAPGM